MKQKSKKTRITREFKIVFGGLLLTILIAKATSLIFGFPMSSPIVVAMSLVAGAIIGDLTRTDK